MSLNSEDKGSGAGGGGGGHPTSSPRLQPGGYAALKPKMHAFLTPWGGVHLAVVTAAKWTARCAGVAAQAEAALDEAEALEEATAAGASASTSSSSTAPPKVSDELKAARKLIALSVERSQRVYTILYAALPEDLCLQVAHIAHGWAYGLWSWLETKFQSTEEDAFDYLLTQWQELRQTEDESFDAYRARVNKVATLLEQAKEKPSARMYAQTLVSKLTAKYKPVVLALKVNASTLTPADKIDWEAVTAQINSYERNKQRQDAADGTAMAVCAQQARTYAKAAGTAQPRTRAVHFGQAASEPATKAVPAKKPLHDTQCLVCRQMGHYTVHCPRLKEAQDAVGGAGSAAKTAGQPTGSRGHHDANGGPRTGGGASFVGGSNRFDPLSDDDSDSDSDSEQDDDESDGDSEDDSTSTGAMACATVADMPPNTLDVDVPATSTVQAASGKMAVGVWGVDTMASDHVTGDRAIRRHSGVAH